MASRSVSASKTLAAAANYGGGDVVSESASAGTAWSWPGLFSGANNEPAFITGGVLVGDNQSRLVRHRLHLFSSNPSNSVLNDNAALSIVDADKEKYLGWLDFPASTDEGTAITSQVSGILHPVTGTNGLLYGILEDIDGETDESAGEEIVITLHSWWD